MVTQFCRKLAAERPRKDIREEYNDPNQKGIKDECSSFFFFSSRRRHTRFSRDWSSDMCSSDLQELPDIAYRALTARLLGAGAERCSEDGPRQGPDQRDEEGLERCQHVAVGEVRDDGESVGLGQVSGAQRQVRGRGTGSDGDENEQPGDGSGPESAGTGHGGR